jgi:hypothetical protein
MRKSQVHGGIPQVPLVKKIVTIEYIILIQSESLFPFPCSHIE